MSDKAGVLIATPVRHWKGVDSLHSDFRTSLACLSAMQDSPYSFDFAVIEGGLARARNKLVASFLKGDYKWLLFWDDDIEAGIADVLKLLSHKQPIVAGLYTTREERPHWVANFMHEVTVQPNGLLQVIEVGTGFKLYHRKVFEILAKHYPNLWYTDRDTGVRECAFFQQAVIATDLKPDGDWLPEDYFCDYICRHANIGIFVDTTMKLKHRGGDGTLFPKEWPPIPVDS